MPGAAEKPALSMPAASRLAAATPPRATEPAERVSRRPSNARSARAGDDQNLFSVDSLPIKPAAPAFIRTSQSLIQEELIKHDLDPRCMQAFRESTDTLTVVLILVSVTNENRCHDRNVSAGTVEVKDYFGAR
jgi:hypothetical protein